MSTEPNTPGKIVAVHLNYRSRADQRGRRPAAPSYFLKSPTTLSRSGASVVRPAGCELLVFEGEIALVVRNVPHNVSEDDAWNHVDVVTAANDFGVYDLRYADPGSNVHSKSWDGFTPVGWPGLRAAAVNPQQLRVRTWVDGEIVQDAGDEDLLFSCAFVLADLSRVMTLKAGDLVLMGTPAGSSVVFPGQQVDVEVLAGDAGRVRLSSPVVEGAVSIPAIGAVPRADADARSAAFARPE